MNTGAIYENLEVDRRAITAGRPVLQLYPNCFYRALPPRLRSACSPPSIREQTHRGLAMSTPLQNVTCANSS